MTQDTDYSTHDLIISHIEETNTVIANIREYQDLILSVSDPELKLIYENDIESENKDLMKLCQNLKYLLSNYMKECKQTDTPIDVNFYRIYKEIRSLEELD